MLPHLLLNHAFVVHRYFSCTSSGVTRILKRSVEVMVLVHNFPTFILPELKYLGIVYNIFLSMCFFGVHCSNVVLYISLSSD